MNSLIKSSSIKVDGGVTSIAFDSQDRFFAGTHFSNIYLVNGNDFSFKRISSCHYSHVNDVCFPA
jgi:hypothetical protein